MAEELQDGESADDIEQAVGQPDVQEFGTLRQEAEDCEQHNSERADGISGKHAVEHGRPLDRARDYESKSGENRGSGAGWIAQPMLLDAETTRTVPETG